MNKDTNAVDKITIVGGGSSGWMTASFLSKTFPEKEIVIIESKDYPIIGVGESTLLDITLLRDYLGIDEKEFMKETNASYKMSIKFTDFYKKDSGSFHYPFSYPLLDGTDNGVFDWMLIKAHHPETPVQDFVRCYFPNSFLFENNKFDDNTSGEFGNFTKKTHVAYHFDATAFGQWLKERYCLPRGVKLIIGSVESAKLNDEGIEYLVLDNGENIYSDLFIDCTGFSSLLLGQYLEEPFISYSDMLPNNRAWATQIPYKNKEEELEPFTNCTAIENGWCWNIPLWSRIGSGYVYSDKYVSSEGALEQFKDYLTSEKMLIPRTREEVDQLVFRDIKMRVGIHERVWVKNVVAIGLSAAFIEPLESNGLFSTQWFFTKLAKSLLRDGVSQWDRDAFNAAVKGIFRNFVEFVALHYALSQRTDTKYWKDINNKTFSPEMVRLEPTTATGFLNLEEQKMFTANPDLKAGILYIATGMNYPLLDRIDLDLEIMGGDIDPFINEVMGRFQEKKSAWERSAKDKLSLYKYLALNIYDE